jgi:hypothetical protein
LWDLSLAKDVGGLSANDSRFIGIKWLSDDTFVAIEASGQVRILKAPGCELVQGWKADLPEAIDWVVSDDGKMLVMADIRQMIHVYDLMTGNLTAELGKAPMKVSGLRLSGDKTMLAAFGAAPTICFWRNLARENKRTLKLPFENGRVQDIRVQPEGNLAICAQGSSLFLTDLVQNRTLSEYVCESDISVLSEVSRHGDIACGTRRGQMHFLKLKAWSEYSEQRKPGAEVVADKKAVISIDALENDG